VPFLDATVWGGKIIGENSCRLIIPENSEQEQLFAFFNSWLSPKMIAVLFDVKMISKYL